MKEKEDGKEKQVRMRWKRGREIGMKEQEERKRNMYHEGLGKMEEKQVLRSRKKRREMDMKGQEEGRGISMKEYEEEKRNRYA